MACEACRKAAEERLERVLLDVPHVSVELHVGRCKHESLTPDHLPGPTMEMGPAVGGDGD